MIDYLPLLSNDVKQWVSRDGLELGEELVVLLPDATDGNEAVVIRVTETQAQVSVDEYVIVPLDDSELQGP